MAGNWPLNQLKIPVGILSDSGFVNFDYRATQSNTHCSGLLASVACRILKNSGFGQYEQPLPLTLETGVYHARIHA